MPISYRSINTISIDTVGIIIQDIHICFMLFKQSIIVYNLQNIYNTIKCIIQTKYDNNMTINTEDKSNILYDISLEQTIIGALLYNNTHCDIVSEILTPDNFYEKLHQRIFEKIFNIYDQGLTADPLTLSHFIRQDDAFKDKQEDGVKYLKELLNKSLSLINIKQLAKTIKQYYLMRKTEELCIDTIEKIRKSNDTSNITDQLENIENKIFELNSDKIDTIHKTNTITAKSLNKIKETIKNDNPTTGISTGFIDMDSILDGLHGSDLIILAARPSMGKTALAINIAVNIANNFYQTNQKKSVAFVSLEMSAEQLMLRIIAMQSEINIHALRRGMITKDQLNAVEQTINSHINKLPLIIDDSPSITISSLRTRLRRLKRKENIECVFIDYLQLIKSKNNSENRVNEISEITQSLKSLAKELDVPIIALSQLSRAVESRDDKLPQLSDLRESGSIEQDADVVMFIYREAYYEERKKPEEGTQKFTAWQQKMESIMNQADIIIAKHRNGPIGFRKLFFDRNITVFNNYKKE